VYYNYKLMMVFIIYPFIPTAAYTVFQIFHSSVIIVIITEIFRVA